MFRKGFMPLIMPWLAGSVNFPRISLSFLPTPSSNPGVDELGVGRVGNSR
jgi:hypothetical protein